MSTETRLAIMDQSAGQFPPRCRRRPRPRSGPSPLVPFTVPAPRRRAPAFLPRAPINQPGLDAGLVVRAVRRYWLFIAVFGAAVGGGAAAAVWEFLPPGRQIRVHRPAHLRPAAGRVAGHPGGPDQRGRLPAAAAAGGDLDEGPGDGVRQPDGRRPPDRPEAEPGRGTRAEDQGRLQARSGVHADHGRVRHSRREPDPGHRGQGRLPVGGGQQGAEHLGAVGRQAGGGAQGGGSDLRPQPGGAGPEAGAVQAQAGRRDVHPAPAS